MQGDGAVGVAVRSGVAATSGAAVAVVVVSSAAGGAAGGSAEQAEASRAIAATAAAVLVRARWRFGESMSLSLGLRIPARPDGRTPGRAAAVRWLVMANPNYAHRVHGAPLAQDTPGPWSRSASMPASPTRSRSWGAASRRLADECQFV